MRKLHLTPLHFAQEKINFYETRIKWLKKMNVFLNVVIIFAGLITTVITSLMVSKLIYSSYPDWFFYATAGISAGTGLATSILNFFIIQDNIKTYKGNLINIRAEIASYESKAKPTYQRRKAGDNDYELFLAVAKITGSKAARKEIKNGKR